MATKGKGKILDGQIAFEFMGVLETEVKPRKTKAVDKEETKPQKVFRIKNVKANRLKKNRKVRRIKN